MARGAPVVLQITELHVAPQVRDEFRPLRRAERGIPSAREVDHERLVGDLEECLRRRDGVSSRLSAALGIGQLEKLDRILSARAGVAARYAELRSSGA